MPNNNSALVRSNLGRSGALSSIANIAQNSGLVDAITRRLANTVIQSIGRQGGGGGGALPQQGGSRRRPRNRGRKSGAQKSVVPPSFGTATLPSIRRILRGTANFAALTANAGVSTSSFAWRVGMGLGSYLFDPSIIGQPSVDFVKNYSSMKVNRVAVKIVPVCAMNTTLTLALGYTNRLVGAPAGLSDFNSLTEYVVGGPTNTLSLTFVPHNAHGGVVPVNTTASDDPGELAAGSVCGYVQTTAATGVTVGIVYIEVDVTLMDA